MISLLDSILRTKTEEPQKTFELCESAYPGIFSSLFESKYNHWQQKIIILYILYGYTKESDWVIIGRDWLAQKKEIAERVELPDTLTDDVVHLKSESIRVTIERYLDVQKERTWKHYKIKQDQYEAMVANSYKKMVDEKGDYDFKMLKDSDEYLDKLRRDILELEETMKSEYQFMDEAKKSIKKIREAGKQRQYALENSRHVKK